MRGAADSPALNVVDSPSPAVGCVAALACSAPDAPRSAALLATMIGADADGNSLLLFVPGLGDAALPPLALALPLEVAALWPCGASRLMKGILLGSVLKYIGGPICSPVSGSSLAAPVGSPITMTGSLNILLVVGKSLGSLGPRE